MAEYEWSGGIIVIRRLKYQSEATMTKLLSQLLVSTLLVSTSLFTHSRSLNAQVIDVMKSGEINTNSPTTKINFESISNVTLGIHQVYQSYFSYEGPQICLTPGEIEVSNGLYIFQADGANGSVDFTVDAMGGTQYWKINPGNSGEMTGGILLSTLGFTTGIIGVTFYSVFPNNTYDNYGNVTSSSPNNWFLAMGIIGLGATIGGIMMVIDGAPTVTLIKIQY